MDNWEPKQYRPTNESAGDSLEAIQGLSVLLREIRDEIKTLRRHLTLDKTPCHHVWTSMGWCERCGEGEPMSVSTSQKIERLSRKAKKKPLTGKRKSS